MLTWTLGALLLAASPATSFEQAPASTVLALADAKGAARPVRLNLPAIVETLRFEPGRRVSIAARADVPATLELGHERLAATVALGPARGQSDAEGRVRTSRSLSLRAPSITLELLLDLSLVPEPDALGRGELVVERAAIVAVTAAEGRLAALELTRHAYLAHPTVPMRWTAPGSVAKWKAETTEGWWVLGAGLYPEAFVDGDEVTVVADDGVESKRWRLRVENGAWTDGERVIEWSYEPGRWVGRARGFTGSIAGAIRLGDADSPMSIDLVASQLPAGERAGL